MTCLSCRSANQAELTAEMIIHFPGLILKNPGVWIFPKLVVCLDCGSSRFTTPKTDLALLARGTAAREVPCVSDKVSPQGGLPPQQRVAVPIRY